MLRALPPPARRLRRPHMFRLQRILSLLALVLATTAGQAQTPPDRPASTAEAQRFLLQATFGPAGDDAESLMKLGYGAWIDRQFGLPATSHRLTWEASDAAIRAITPAQGAGQNEVFDSFWKQALTGPDQLRQRLVFALSEIFVISGVDGAVGNEPRAMAAWLDMLGDKGTTTYRQLLESVSLHPMMGRYLSHLRNQKADPVTGRVPDQNYAREVMQLLSIGLVQLNPDGTPVMVNNRTVETYGPDDVAGLAKVFTGWSWDCPAAPNTSCFNNGTSGGVSDPDRQFKPMIPYPQFHSTEAKAFLGVTIPPQTTPDPRESLRVALNTLDAHPNTAPFISKALIQRFTVSNPSPAYVRAVAGVFINNGAGVRGDLKAVVKAILTHPEARTPANANSTGKLREPVLRLSAYLRAFPHISDTGRWRIGNTDSAANALGQTPLRSPSVFNFFRPGYVAPNTATAAAGLIAPEMQLLNETSAAGWVNYMRDNLSNGVGSFNGTVGTTVFNRRDLQRNWDFELELAVRPESLARFVTQRLLVNQYSEALKNDIAAQVASITVPTPLPDGSNLAAVTAAKRNRIFAALLLTMATPEFLTLK
jgi:uncharacterized protein (DUF1800 family)